jgi:hypothetical protein
MKKILSLLFFAAFASFANAQVPVLKAGQTSADTEDYPKNALRFTFENKSGKAIANCDFQLIMPEGVSVKKKTNGKPDYKKGDATGEMGSFSVQYSEKTGKYSVTIYDMDGNTFDETAGHTIIYLPLEGDNLTGTVTVTNINFGDPDGNDFETQFNEEIADFTVELLATAINGISAEQTKSGAIYNMAGQRVSKANKGIYVVDGKKVAVK